MQNISKTYNTSDSEDGQKMKVLVISSMYPSQDNPIIGIFVKRQIGALERLGVEVILVKSINSTPHYNILRRYSELLWQSLKNVRQSFEVIHVHYPTFTGVYGGLIKLARRKPLVVTLHGSEIIRADNAELAPWKRWLTAVAVNWTLSQADAIITVGSELAKLVIRKGIPEHKISVIDMGVDCQIFHPGDKSEMRKELGLNPTNPLIIFVGSLTSIKGPEYFIRAAKLLKNRYPNCRWYLIGKGPLEPMLRALVEEIDLGNQVIFVGQCPPDKVAMWDAAADILVMPSLSEGFGLAALEAMACGTPVVASDVGGLRGFIIDGLNGFLVPPAHPEAIASKVYRLLSESDLCRKVGVNAIETAQQHNLHRQAQKVLMVYKQLLARQRDLQKQKTSS